MDKKLEIGKIYRIAHQRKGHFTAQLIDIVKAPDSDGQDDVFLQVKYDVRIGTDQGHLATQRTQKVRVSNLRPSLILKIDEVQEEHWLREIKVPEEEKPKTNDSLTSKIARLFGRS